MKHGVYKTGSKIKFETSMLRSSLCYYSDVYIIVEGTIKVKKTGTAAGPDNENCAPFTD